MNSRPPHHHSNALPTELGSNCWAEYFWSELCFMHHFIFWTLLPPAYEVRVKVMFWHVSVCLSVCLSMDPVLYRVTPTQKEKHQPYIKSDFPKTEEIQFVGNVRCRFSATLKQRRQNVNTFWRRSYCRLFCCLVAEGAAGNNIVLME